MIESLKNEVATHGDKAAVFPVYRLREIQQDLEDLKSSVQLNNFQQYILSNLYNLNVLDTGFEVRSVIITASPSPTAIELLFTYQSTRIPMTLVASYMGKDRVPLRVEGYLNAFLNPQGYHVFYASQLPRKRIAVRSGLAQYGRNNICFVEGMGSFLNLTPFFSDIPCEEDPWRGVHQMELCHTCQACLRSCPTGAILPERFLIDNERCLPYFNEAGREWNFPDWIDASVHHTLYGCLRCQTICPANKPYLNTITGQAEFSEEETAMLLEGQPFENFPESLRKKVQAFEMTEYLGALPRNMRALLNNAQKMN